MKRFQCVKIKNTKCLPLWQRPRKQEALFTFCSPLALFSSNNFLPPSILRRGSSFGDFPPRFRLLVLLLLLFDQFVDLPLGHGCVLGDDAVLVQAGQQQQDTHCRRKKKNNNKKSVNSLETPQV